MTEKLSSENGQQVSDATAVERRARDIWAEREKGFPPFVQRAWEQGTGLARETTLTQAARELASEFGVDRAAAKLAELERFGRESRLRLDEERARMSEAEERRAVHAENRHARRVARAFAKRLGE